ncbi:MAG: hypothetical protein JNK37_18160 [Verrucomicrobiales bacterium]|nr:hypothetical protein [Verrucomicrobiales bacterium]
MKNRRTTWLCLLALLSFLTWTGRGSVLAEDAEIRRLQTGFVEAMARLEQPLIDLDARYLENVRTWQKSAQERGDLEAALAAKSELEGHRKAGARNFDSWPELKRLREIYDTAAAKLAGELGEERLRLYTVYRQSLQGHVERLTRENRLDEAVKLQAEVKSIDGRIEGAKAAASATQQGAAPVVANGAEELLWELKGASSLTPVGKCDARTTDGVIKIAAPGENKARFETRRSFKPPFRIQARVGTDSTNIRFYYNNNVLTIFNWEMNQNELRVHEPSTNRNIGIGGKGKLAVNQMHDVEIDVFDKKVVVKGNGTVLAEVEVRSDGLESPVGLGPAFNSVVSLESLRVWRLKP